VEAHGTIVAADVHEIPNKAMGKPPRRETRLRIDVTAVFDDRGRPVEGFPYDDFRGDSGLLAGYGVGDRVKVVYAPSTGRRITSVTRLD
jgi:hypothetical protein